MSYSQILDTKSGGKLKPYIIYTFCFKAKAERICLYSPKKEDRDDGAISSSSGINMPVVMVRLAII
jgi:hypothetical protein